MTPVVISEENSPKRTSKASLRLITLGGAILLVLVGDTYPWVLFGLGVLALAYLMMRHVCSPNRMHACMDYLAQRIEGFQMVPAELFEGKDSPKDPVRNFTLTFRGKCDLATVRELLVVLFETEFDCEIKMLRSGNFHAITRKSPSKGYEVFSREHEKVPGLFRVRVERVFL